MNHINATTLTHKRNLLTIFLLFICSASCIAQEIATEIEGKTAKQFFILEKRLGNKTFIGAYDIVVPMGMATPVVFRRKETSIPDMLVTYTFNEKDSLIQKIEYEIDMINFDREAKGIPKEMQKAMIKKYNELLAYLSKKLGKSEQEGDLSDLAKLDQPKGLRRSDSWAPNDTTNIDLYSIFSNRNEETGNIKTRATNRIRLSISKNQKPASELSKKNIELARETFNQFILKLKAGDMEGSKATLNPQIRSALTEAIFNQLKTSIKPEDFKIYTRGMRELNGIRYLVIEYAYVSSPELPKEIIRVVYDKENLILGIQPLAIQEIKSSN